jgi:hypothetical protein
MNCKRTSGTIWEGGGHTPPHPYPFIIYIYNRGVYLFYDIREKNIVGMRQTFVIGLCQKVTEVYKNHAKPLCARILAKTRQMTKV